MLYGIKNWFFRVRPPRRPQQIIDHPVIDIQRREQEYAHLYRSTEDKDGLESIRALHRQLDDDNDGSIEPSETGDFIRGDLKKVRYYEKIALQLIFSVN